MADGAAVGMCQERREGKGSQDRGFSAFVGTRQERMTLVGAKFYREGLSQREGDMEVGRVTKMKDGFRRGDPLDGMNLWVMIEFYMDFQGTDIL